MIKYLKRRVFSIILSILMVASVICLPIRSIDVDYEVNSFPNIFNKFHFYFGEDEHATIDDIMEFQDATSQLKELHGDMNTYSLHDFEADDITLTIEFESNFMNTEVYKAFSTLRGEVKSYSELYDLRDEFVEYSKEFHANLIDYNMELISGIEYSNIERVEYSPFVILTVDASEINEKTLLDFLASESIVNVSLSPELTVESEATWTETLSEINAYDIVSNGVYTGENVRIGIYEAGGICDVNHINLQEKNITVRDSTEDVSEHATNVTSIVANMVPDAEYFVSDVDRMGIAWFIEQGCDTVNCSFGYYDNIKQPDGTYEDQGKQYRYNIDAIYDYQIVANFVSVIKSAGNYNNDNTTSSYNPQNQITSPGYAYNVITVGGVDLDNVNGQVLLRHASGASYVCSSPRVKPNVSAMFTVNIPNIGLGGGTSYAAPQVTACVALLKDSDLQYLAYPERVMSVITSTARKTDDYANDIGAFNNKVGAGIVDLQKMIDSSLHKSKFNGDNTPNSEVYSREVTVPAGVDLNVALTWFANPVVDTSSTELAISGVNVTDYDLKIYTPSGRLLYSTLSNSNVELIRHRTTEAGTYRFVIYQYGNMASSHDGDWLSLTYNY